LLSTVYPHWFILICIFTGASFAFSLYFVNYFRKGKGIFTFPSWIMFAIRFVVISLISFFLLSPFLKKNFRKDEKPIIILAADNSASILLNKDSVYYSSVFEEDLTKLRNQLKTKYTIVDYTFGNNVNSGIELDFTDSRTNMYEILNHIYEQNYNKNIGAIIVASDGNYNAGRDPLGLINDFKAPFYTIALGDTSPSADLLISKVRHNQIAYLGNTIPIKIGVNAEKFKNKKLALSLSNNNQVIKNWNFDINHQHFSHTIDYLYDANKSGLQHFTLQIKELDGEISFANNYADFYIDVLESRKSVVLLANSPHPDINALRRSIEKNDNFKLKIIIASEINRNPQLYQNEILNADLVILHQLPSVSNPLQQLFASLEKNSIPMLVILGSQTALPQLNKLNLGLTIQYRNQSFEEVFAEPNSAFSYFSLSTKNTSIIKDLPPLIAPFGRYSINLENEVLFNQKIGQVISPYPLIFYVQDIDKRLGFICGEGIWRWPLAEFRINQTQTYFNDLIQKSIQFISIKEDKRYFHLKDFNGDYFEDQAVQMEVELYNKSYEKFPHAKIELEIIQDGIKSTFQFIETEEGYRANLGYLKAGKYSFTASTTSAGSLQKLTGSFFVKKVEVEYINTTANHQLMYHLAEAQNGKMLYPDQMGDIENLIENLNLKSRSSFEMESRDLIELKWLFFLIILLLATEWFFRKFFGSY
jgi:hypothetical protein